MKKKNKLNYYTYKFNMVTLNILAIILFFIVGGLVFFLEYQDPYVSHVRVITLFIFMFIWLVIHELLHGIAFYLFKSVDNRNITFGMFLEKGVFYCMCKQNISKQVILTSLLFPVTIIGIITLVIGMRFNLYELVFLSVLNIVSSIGDLVMAVYFFRVPNDIIYLDLDDCTSFTVLSSHSLDHIRVPGIVLEKKGIYDQSKMVARDKRRLIISKASYVFLFFILILILINIVGGFI